MNEEKKYVLQEHEVSGIMAAWSRTSNSHYELCRAVEAEVISRCRAEGGDTINKEVPVLANAGAPAKLTDERIGQLYREAQDQSTSGISPSVHFARAIESEVLSAHAGVKAEPAAPVRPTDDDLWDQTLRERDHNADMADKLAEAIGKHFGIEVGEHSNMNCPWQTALDWIESESTHAEMEAEQAQVEPIGWLYDWTHSSALGKPDEHFTGFTTDREYAFKTGHENQRLVYTALPTQAEQVEAVPNIVREAVEAAFEDREGWRIKIAAAVRAVDNKRSNVLPPTRGTESQQEAVVEVLTNDELNAMFDPLMPSLPARHALRSYGRAVEAEVARRFRAQGGNTSTESSNIATKEAAAQVPAADIRAALKTISEFPVTDPGNMDAWNMQAIAIRALAAPSTTTSNDTSALGGTGGDRG